MPIYTVEKDGFRTMVEALNPQYQLPYKDYFSRTAIPELYERTREQIAAKVKKIHNIFQLQLIYSHHVLPIPISVLPSIT